MIKTSTLYTNLQEVLLDLDIFGTLVQEKIPSKEEFKKILEVEYRRTHKKPTLEDKRYELSALVSSDYKVRYEKELQLEDDEEECVFGADEEPSEGVKPVYDIDEIIDVPRDIQQKFSINNRITDADRLEILHQLNYFEETEGVEEFNGDVDAVEAVQGTITTPVAPIEEPDEVVGVSSRGAEVDETDDEMDYEDDGSDDDFGYDEEVDDGSDDDDDFGFPDEQPQYEEPIKQVEEPSYEINGEDVEEIDDGSDDDFGYDEDEEVDDGSEGFEQSYQEPVVSETNQIGVVQMVETNADKEKSFVDSVFDDTIDATKVASIINKEVVPKPLDIVTPVQPKQEPQKEEPVNLDAEPKNIMDFLRKHPHSEVGFVLKYFPKKEVQKQIMMGNIIKKGNKLHI